MAVACGAGAATCAASTSKRCVSAPVAALDARQALLGRPCRGLTRPRLCSRERLVVQAHLDLGLLHSLHSLQDAVNHTLTLAYEPVALPCSLMKCGDVVHRSTLDLALRKELRGLDWRALLLFATAGVYLFATPGPLPGFLDYYFLRHVQGNLAKKAYGKEDIILGKKLASGGFGTVYKGELADNKAKDKSIIIKKAKEFGEAEVWMNERMQRASSPVCAEIIAAFDERYSGKMAKENAVWIVWAYEGDFTLWDMMQKKDFPYNLEPLLLDRELRLERGPMRRLVMFKIVARQLLEMLAACHSTGIVHRDFKPQNVIISEKDKRLKLIDLGAAADLRIGVNYVPNEYLMDPRYAPPYRFIMSTQTPKPPPKPVAAFLSPVLWRMNRPDVFDSYSCGVTLLQLAFPALRSDNQLIAFNKRLEQLDYNLTAWRREEENRAVMTYEYAEGLELLDMEPDGGWDLICQLMKKKPSERISATEALEHPWLGRPSDKLVPSIMSSMSQKVLSSVKALKGVNMDFIGDVGDAITHAKSDPLTEGQLARELGYHAPAPTPAESRQTIAWWEERQADVRKKLDNQKRKVERSVEKVGNLRTGMKKQARDVKEPNARQQPAPRAPKPFFKMDMFNSPANGAPRKGEDAQNAAGNGKAKGKAKAKKAAPAGDARNKQQQPEPGRKALSLPSLRLPIGGK